jgi:ATP synthase subunit K
MATLGASFGGAYMVMRGGDKKTAQAPPINASSKDEEAFIQYGQLLPSSSNGLLTLLQRLSQKCGGRRKEGEGIRKRIFDDDCRNAPVKATTPCK